MYRWFNRATGISDVRTEPELVIEKDETLWCTPNGQVAELNSRPVYSFTQAKAKALAEARPTLEGDALVQAVTRRLKLPPRTEAPDYRILRPLPPRKHPKRYAVTYAVDTEPNVHALVYLLLDERHFSRPPGGKERALLYVSHHSSDSELRDEPFVRELFEAEGKSELFTCDVRGVGESRPNTCGLDTFLAPYGCDYFYAIHSIMLDYPYVGQKTHDVLCVLDWLASCGYRQIHLAGKGWGALPAAFAALVSHHVVQVTLKNALTSYADIARSVDYDWPLSCLLPGVLEDFDLPDCYRALEAKGLRRIESWGASAQPM
jgi:hypothetical protein